MVPRTCRSASAASRSARRAPAAGYNSYLQIVQSPSAVVLLQEMAHDARIVPVTTQAHLNTSARQWLGDPRGRWEGDMFVVETTNYRDGFMGSTKDVKITERYHARLEGLHQLDDHG